MKLLTPLSWANTSRGVTGSVAIDAMIWRISDTPATVFSARICAPAKNRSSRRVSAPQFENTL
jgi:hypothetical protein